MAKEFSVGDILGLPTQEESEKSRQREKLKKETERLKNKQKEIDSDQAEVANSSVVVTKNLAVDSSNLAHINKQLRKEIEHYESSLKELQYEFDNLREKSIPMKDARGLTYKALKKGRALQYLHFLISNSTINFKYLKEGFYKIASETFGPEHIAFRKRYGESPGAQAILDSRLRLFRQEQLFLISENERLSNRLKEIQTNRLSNIQERVGERDRFGSQFYEQNLKQTGSVASLNTQDLQDNMEHIEIDTNLILKSFFIFDNKITILILKNKYYAFRRLRENVVFSSGHDAAIQRWELIKVDVERQASNKLDLIFKKLTIKRLYIATMRLKFNANREAFPIRSNNFKNEFNNGYEQGIRYMNTKSRSTTGGYMGNHPSANYPLPTSTETPPAYIYQPYYYSSLPSLHTRNIFYPNKPMEHLKPPRIYSGLLGSNEEDILYRPVTGLSGWGDLCGTDNLEMPISSEEIPTRPTKNELHTKNPYENTHTYTPNSHTKNKYSDLLKEALGPTK